MLVYMDYIAIPLRIFETVDENTSSTDGTKWDVKTYVILGKMAGQCTSYTTGIEWWTPTMMGKPTITLTSSVTMQFSTRMKPHMSKITWYVPFHEGKLISST